MKLEKIIYKSPLNEILPVYFIKNGKVYLQERKEVIEDIYPEVEETIDNHFLRDYEEDFPEYFNELEEYKKERIKRYKKIVNRLKNIYDGKCQICNFAFLKDNGDNYCEAHHLVPISQGGSQEEINVVILCANHHRMLHYGKGVLVGERIGKSRKLMIDGLEHDIIYKV